MSSTMFSLAHHLLLVSYLATKMSLLNLFVCFALCAPLALGAPSILKGRAVAEEVLDDLVLYTKYASAVELITGPCPKPLDSTLVEQVRNLCALRWLSTTVLMALFAVCE